MHRVDQETIFLNEPGTRPEDNCELAALSLANLKGESKTYSWEKGYPKLDLPAPVIQMVNLNSRFKPLIIVKPGSTIATFNCEVRKEFSHFPMVEPLAGRADLERRPLRHGARPGGPFLAQLGHATGRRVPLWHDGQVAGGTAAPGQSLDSPAAPQDLRELLLQRWIRARTSGLTCSSAFSPAATLRWNWPAAPIRPS